MPGATVTYTVDIVNGRKTLTNTTQFTAFTVSSEVTATNVACKDGANNTVALAGPVSPVDVAANATIITCTFDVGVSTTHAASGQLPSFTVTAAFTSSPADLSLTMEPITVPAVPVQTGSALAVAAAVPRTGTFLQGDHIGRLCELPMADVSLRYGAWAPYAAARQPWRTAHTHLFDESFDMHSCVGYVAYCAEPQHRRQ